MYKPQDGKLWAYNKPKLDYTHFSEIPSADGNKIMQNAFKETKEKKEADEDEENDVELKSTMWLIIRKKRSPNQVLKDFFPNYQQQMVRVRDIIKFGRVNFKISALHCDRVDQAYNGTCYQPPNTTRLRKFNEDTIVEDAYGPVNRITQIDDDNANRSLIDDRTIDQAGQLTEMNLVDRSVTRLNLHDES